MIFLDFSADYQMLFQDPASPMMNGIIDLHHYIMFFLFIILIFVVIALSYTLETFVLKQKIHNLSFYVFHFGRDMYIFLYSRDRHRRKILRRLLRRYDTPEVEVFIQKKRKIALTAQWNNNWSTLCSFSKNSSTDFFLSNYRFSLINLLAVKKNFVTTGVNFLTIDDEPVLETHFSNYVLNVFLHKKKYTRSLPEIAVRNTSFYLRTRTLEALGVVNIYYSYARNVFYWAQTLFTLRSGIQNFTHSTVVEIVWTVVPSLILVFIGIPSFILLYAMDEIIEPQIVIKCIGHQWYWSYEVGHPQFNHLLEPLKIKSFEDFISVYLLTPEELELIEKLSSESRLHQQVVSEPTSLGFNLFDKEGIDTKENLRSNEILKNDEKDLYSWGYINYNSYMVPEDELKNGQLRLLEVDNALFLPTKTHIDLMVTANDVIHCWTVPSFGVKMDAVPGRINHTNIFVEREGVFYGQCSEICGVNHGFMPIKVIATSIDHYNDLFTKMLSV